MFQQFNNQSYLWLDVSKWHNSKAMLMAIIHKIFLPDEETFAIQPWYQMTLLNKTWSSSRAQALMMAYGPGICSSVFLAPLFLPFGLQLGQDEWANGYLTVVNMETVHCYLLLFFFHCSVQQSSSFAELTDLLQTCICSLKHTCSNERGKERENWRWVCQGTLSTPGKVIIIWLFYWTGWWHRVIGE